MRFVLTALAILTLAGCATRRLPRWERPLPRTQLQSVRTTAYFDGENDHLKYANHNAIGSALCRGPLNSAAADWGRWPVGTIFRILPSGECYIVDDYGWAIAGTNTIDLYRSSRAEMNAWGVRRVDIEILSWGDLRESYRILQPREKYRHVARMLSEIRAQL